jgi:hypothetical protein
LAESAESRPRRYAVASRALTRRLRPRGSSYEEDGGGSLAVGQRSPCSPATGRRQPGQSARFEHVFDRFTYSKDHYERPDPKGSHRGEPTPTDSPGRRATAHRICAGERLPARLSRTCPDTRSVAGVKGRGSGLGVRSQTACQGPQEPRDEGMTPACRLGPSPAAEAVNVQRLPTVGEILILCS